MTAQEAKPDRFGAGQFVRTVFQEEPLRVPSRLEIWMVALAGGALVCAVSLLLQWYVYVYLRGGEGLRLTSPVIAWAVTTVFVEYVLAASRRRRLATRRRFQIIAEMNHHIRNSLQLISYQSFSADPEAAPRIKQAVDRIQWVLEEVLPEIQEEHGAAAAAEGADPRSDEA